MCGSYIIHCGEGFDGIYFGCGQNAKNDPMRRTSHRRAVGGPIRGHCGTADSRETNTKELLVYLGTCTLLLRPGI